MNKLFALLLALFALLACQPPTNYTYMVRDQHGHLIKVEPVYLDEKWNAEEVAAIEVAINNWNAALNNQMRLEVKDEHYKINASDPGLMIIKIKDQDREAQQSDVLIAYAWTNWIGGNRVFVVRDRPIWDYKAKKEHPWDMRDLQEIVMHEVGHALGSDHIRYKGLMAAVYDKEEYECIDMQAVLAVSKYQHLDQSRVHWCEHQSGNSSSQ